MTINKSHQEPFKLYDEKGKSAGYFDVLLWICDNYPEDIFVLENPEFLEIRDRARRLLIKHHPNKMKINKSPEGEE